MFDGHSWAATGQCISFIVTIDADILQCCYSDQGKDPPSRMMAAVPERLFLVSSLGLQKPSSEIMVRETERVERLRWMKTATMLQWGRSRKLRVRRTRSRVDLASLTIVPLHH